MSVITRNAERLFFEELKMFRDEFPTYRCVYLRFSQLEQDKEIWFETLLDTTRRFFNDDFNSIYLCYDGDVFLLTRTMTHKRLEQFLAHLTPQLTPALLQGLASLFEIGVDWPRLRTLSEKKIENFEIYKAQQKSLMEQKRDLLSSASVRQTVESVSSEMVFSLPLRRTERRTPEVMVVEDDLFSQKLVTNALRGKYSVSMTRDGQGAILNYVTKAPDVLFLDIGLPDITGHEVLEKLFRIDPDAYVVMFSGNGDRENVMRAIELGAKGFVGKPFTQEKLIHYIERSPFIQAKLKREMPHGNSVC